VRRAPFPSWRPRRDPELPYRLEWKEVHGQLVRVKVYQTTWALGAHRQTRLESKRNHGRLSAQRGAHGQD